MVLENVLISMRYHFTLVRMAIIKKSTNIVINAGEGVEKRTPSYIVGGNVNWYSHYGDQYGDSLKKLKVELPHDPAIPLLGIYLEKTIIQKDTCTPVQDMYYSQDMEAT